MFRFLKFRKSVKFDRELLTARLLHPDWKCAGFAPICPSVPVPPVLGPPALLCGKQKAANVFPAFISALKSTVNAKVLLQGNLSLCPSPTSFGATTGSAIFGTPKIAKNAFWGVPKVALGVP